MPERTSDILESVAEAVADFGSPDWDALTEQNDRLADTLRMLRRLQGIASNHRAPVAPAARHAERRWGALEVRERLGFGHTGDVFRAFDPKLQREVALKLQAAGGDAESSLAEARRLARVRHANVLTVHGADLIDGQVGIWTDLLRGHTLEERLKREGVLDATEATLIGIEVCRALRAVHDASLVHGDVKAANVMREDDGSIVLLDFGSARVLAELEFAEPTWGEGDACGDALISGTPLVMAPELFLGDEPLPSADIYALGVLLYRLTSGEYPVPAASLDELLEAHRRGRRTPLRGLRPELDGEFANVVERAIAPEAAARFTSAREMERALAACLERGGATASPGPSRRAATIDNLPPESSSFVGRAQQLAQLTVLVRDHREVTLTGTGGAGKTRLALQVASALRGGEFEQIAWVELATLSDPALILPAIGSALGLRETARGDWVETVARHCADRRALLVLDNCEHLIDGCTAVIGRLLRAAPTLSVLTTSREILGVPGEIVYPAPPLGLPNETEGASIEELRKFEATDLFLQRAAACGARISSDVTTAAQVAAICRRLDGIPLAIELAAARARSISPAQILERLDDRFRLLDGGPRWRPRHQTLTAMIDWSYGLLTEQEQRLFVRLSIFVDGWSLESAEAIGGDSALELLTHLVDKSLIERRADTTDQAARFGMLETIRAYAWRRLEESGEREALAQQRLDHFAAFVRSVSQQMRTSSEDISIRRLRVDFENVRAALEQTLAGPEETLAVPFLVAMAKLWYPLGHWNEGREYCGRGLAKLGPRWTDSAERFDLLAAAGYLAVQQGDLIEATQLQTEALRIALLLDDKRRVGASYGYLGNIAYVDGRCADALEFQGRALAIAREVGDTWRVGICLSNLANVLELKGDLDDARLHHELSLEAARATGDPRSTGYALCRLGDLALIQGRYDSARVNYEESLSLRRQIGDRWGIAVSLVGVGEVFRKTGAHDAALPLLEEGVSILRELGDQNSLGKVLSRMAEGALEQGDLDRARRLWRESLTIAARIEARRDIAMVLLSLAVVANESGETEHAARLLGATERILSEIEASPYAAATALIAEERATLVLRLGAENAEMHFRAGRELDDRRAVEEALGAR